MTPLERGISALGTMKLGRQVVATLQWLRTNDPEAFAAIQVELGMEAHAVLDAKVVELEGPLSGYQNRETRRWTVGSFASLFAPPLAVTADFYRTKP